MSELTPWQKSIAIEYTPMAERIATREWKNKYNQVLSYEETQSLAYLGLVKACSHVEPGRDGLITYFERYMVGEIQEFLRRLDHAPRRIRGLINQLPEKVKITSKADVMILLQCSSKDAETILAVVSHSDQSLEGLSAGMIDAVGYDYETVDAWEHTYVISRSLDLNDQNNTTDIWLDDLALAYAVFALISMMDLESQAIMTMNYVEGLKISNVSTQLNEPPAVIYKLHDSASEHVRDFVSMWVAA